ncbi:MULTISPECIES: hypothetical protein [Acinetobacter]|uniref:Uncharacterized protein n=3 Tax=Acinetobacter TaxID=469 RepID=N9C2H1_9GAMM|nr:MULTISPECIES: hypothetical protein [Acinetobacter]ENV80022.1 hypothetical protein F942_01305 [Acinetobacter ursingii ANC 3649]PZT85518.1 MAG: hypothetical protein DI627_12395 [Acinetobacter sp.]QXZ22781.1 hypothetical protein I6L31_13970 [Acinetobacter septicus]RSC21987.1 hypothetical protein EGS47_03970 [Acinetobacter sp. FDAARGOS_515]
MFKTEELNQLLKIFPEQAPSQNVQQQILNQYVNLEATILRAKVLRSMAPVDLTYMIQSAIKQDDMNVAYVFSPFILANLNKKTIYSTPFTPMIRDLLSPFYQVHHHTQIHIDRTLESLNLYLDIFEYDDDLDFVFLKLIQAICRSDTSKIFILTYLKTDLEILNQMSHFLKVKIYVIKQQAGDVAFRSNQIDQKKLLFKRKDDLHQKLCHEFSEINVPLIMLTHGFSPKQAHHLIEDMFYSEHIFEKISVYAEYIQTQIQNVNMLKRLESSSI